MDTNGIIGGIIGLLLIGGLLYLFLKLRKGGNFHINARALIFIIAGFMLIVSYWLAVNATPSKVGWVFFAANIATILYTAIEPIVAQSFNRAVASSAAITGRSLLIQSISGVFFGALIIFFSSFTGFTIAIPTVSFAIGGNSIFQALVTIFVAPVTEELFFLAVVPSLLALIFFSLTGSKTAGIILSLVLSSVTFSLFHYAAYGTNISIAIGAFTGAFLFRLMMILAELIKEHDLSVIAGANTVFITIPAHMIFNTYIYAKPLVITGGSI